MQTRLELEQENAQIRAKLLAQQATVNSQQEQLAVHDQALKSKDRQIDSQTRVIDQLKEALILERNRRFAKSTESLRSLQSELFDEAELESSPDTAPVNQDNDPIHIRAYQRKKGGRQPLPEDLPRIEVIHDLDESDKVCDQGHALVPMGDKVSEQLDIIPMKIQVIRHIRKQYHCPCCDGVIKTADKPKQAIEQSQASAGTLAYVVTGKYADALPLYRQSQILKRVGIEISRGTLANWAIQSGQLIQPLINRLEEHLLQAPFLHMDETPVQVLNEAGKAATSKSYMWVRGGAPPNHRIILFDYDPSRSGAVPERLLPDYQGALMVDGYEGYSAVCQSQSIQRLGCWVHARRKFIEVGKASKKKNTQAAYAIKLIGKLYRIERAHKDSTPQVRFRARQAQAKPVIDKLKHWLDETQPRVPPKTALGKALHYLHSQWPRLIGYLDDGDYPIDNNRVENAIRPFAIGRKNWLFSTSVQGVKASANLYSLIETAKANNLEPYAYLKRIFTELPSAENYEDIDRLLPWKITQ